MELKMLSMIALFFGAFFNRLRGGLIDQIWPDNGVHNIVWKLINALVFGLFIGYALHNILVIPAAAIGMFIGAMFKWPWLNALQEHYEVPKNLLYSALRGLLWATCIAGSIAYFDIKALYFIPVGALFGLPYYLSSFINKDKARAWGEYIWGAILWGSLYAII